MMAEDHRGHRKPIIKIVLTILILLIGGGIAGLYFYKASLPPEYRIEIVADNSATSVKNGYFVFRYVWPDTILEKNKNSLTACVCLSGPLSAPSFVSFMCPDKEAMDSKTCPVSIKVARQGQDYQPYEKERRAPVALEYVQALEAVLGSGSHHLEVGVIPGKKRRAQIKNIYIDSKPMDKFLRDYHPSSEVPQ